jgi:hypothetical protein
MNREIQSFKDMKVYKICPMEESQGKLIQSRWVYAVKTDPTAAEKEKSRILVKGFTQKKGVNYYETYSPVMEFSNFLIICQYARAKELGLWRFDISVESNRVKGSSSVDLADNLKFLELCTRVAKYLYQACVSDEVFEEICDCEYATEMHTALDEKYNVQSVARQVQLQMELQKVYRKYEETFADYYRRARGIQQTLKDSGYETEEATFCAIVYQGIRPNDIRDPLLATVKASDLHYSDVQERLRQLDTMYPLEPQTKKHENQSYNRRGSWRQEYRGGQRGYRRGGRGGGVFHAERDCYCKRLAKKGSACNICKSEKHWSCRCDKRRSRDANVVEASYVESNRTFVVIIINFLFFVLHYLISIVYC